MNIGMKTRDEHDVKDGSIEQSRMEPNVELIDAEEKKQIEFTVKYDQISNRSIVKEIIKFCGNKGIETDANKATSRRLFQAVIFHLEKESYKTWKNFEVQIYDESCGVYSIHVGNGRALFVATLDGTLRNIQVLQTCRSGTVAKPDIAQSRMKEIVESTVAEENKQIEFTVKYDQISNRSIGKEIIKFCGNKGIETDANKATSRRLFQAVIFHLEKESYKTWKNFEVQIYDESCGVYSIHVGNGRALFVATLDGTLRNIQVLQTCRSGTVAKPDIAQSRMKEIVESTVAEENKQKIFNVKYDQINKRSIGKAIIKFCGNEGTENDDNKATLRRLMQAVISHIQKESPETWENAEVKIYDDNLDVYSIRAGHGRALFLATFDGLGNPQVVRTRRSRIETKHVRGNKCSVM